MLIRDALADLPTGSGGSTKPMLPAVQIELVSWDHTCGDGCCYDYGVDLIVDGERLTPYAEQNLQSTLQQLLDKLGIPAEVHCR